MIFHSNSKYEPDRDIYELVSDRHIVLIIKIGHGSEVYR
jgi:hypothetical protein